MTCIHVHVDIMTQCYRSMNVIIIDHVTYNQLLLQYSCITDSALVGISTMYNVFPIKTLEQPPQHYIVQLLLCPQLSLHTLLEGIICGLVWSGTCFSACKTYYYKS